MEQKITNCKNCGAPLHNGKCDYCGTEYESYNPIPIHLEVRDCQTETLAVTCSMSLLDLKYMDPVRAAEHIRYNAARKMADEIVKYMDVETWIKPETAEQVFGCRIRVVKGW